MAERSNHPAVFAGLLGTAAWGLPQVSALLPTDLAVGTLANQFLTGCVGGALVAGAALYGHDMICELRERREEGEQLLIARGGTHSASDTAVLEVIATAEAVEARTAKDADDMRVVAPRRKASHPAQPSPAAHKEQSDQRAQVPVITKSIPTRDSKDPLVAKAMRPATHRGRQMTSVGYPLATRIPEINAAPGPATLAVPNAEAGLPPYGSGRWSTGSLDAAREQARASEAETTGDLGRVRTGRVTVDIPNIEGQKSSPDRRVITGRHAAGATSTSQGRGRHFSNAAQSAPQPTYQAASMPASSAADDTFAQMNLQSFGVKDVASEAKSRTVNQVLAERLGGDALGIVPRRSQQNARQAAPRNPRFTGEPRDRASYISSHVAEVNEGMFPERRSMDDLESRDPWEEAMSSMGESLGQRTTPVFQDAVGGPATIDEPDGLEGPTGFIPFRVPASHPEVVDTLSYIDYLLHEEFSRNSSKALRRSARSHLRVIEGGTMPMRMRRSDTDPGRKPARHFAPTNLAQEA